MPPFFVFNKILDRDLTVSEDDRVLYHMEALELLERIGIPFVFLKQNQYP